VSYLGLFSLLLLWGSQEKISLYTISTKIQSGYFPNVSKMLSTVKDWICINMTLQKLSASSLRKIDYLIHTLEGHKHMDSTYCPFLWKLA
jgi:hypothetical protein